MFVSGIGDESGQDVGFEEEVLGIHGLQSDFFAGQAFSGFHIGIYFIVHATFQFGALSGQLLRVKTNVLVTCRTGRYRNKVFHPCGAAHFPSTGADATDASGFLACTDLFHLDTYAESFGKHFDELAEIHTSISDVIEDGFAAVALIFHVADFHLQAQVFGNLAGTYHSVVFPALGFLVFLDVCGFGLSINPFNFLFRFEVGLFDLQGNKPSGEGDHADVVSRAGFHGHGVALFEWQMVGVAVISFTGIFELHFHQVGGILASWDIGQVVVGVQLFILPATAFGAKPPAEAAEFELFVHFAYDVWLLYEQHDHFKSKVEKHEFRVHVLPDVTLREFQFVHDAHDVAFVDEAGEVFGEIRLLRCHVV